MHKIILFYKFVEVADTESVMLWQRNLCERLNLLGRIIIAPHGINGTVGGDIKDVKTYVKEMKTHSLLKGMQFKWSDGVREDFPKLSVKVRSELVTLAPGEQFDVLSGTKGLGPEAWHKYLSEHPETFILDARNSCESDIGAFKGRNVVKPQIDNFRDIKETLETLPKDQPIATYCTGDVRCEYLSAYMKHRGFQDVYHLDGGIIKYGQRYKDGGLWEGACYVFDKRIKINFGPESKDIGRCVHCGSKTSEYINCGNKSCNAHVLVCSNCQKKYSTCGKSGCK